MPRRRRSHLYILLRNRHLIRKWGVLHFDAVLDEVKLSSEYEVSAQDCSCTGYQMKRDCKHIELFNGTHSSDPSTHMEALFAARVVEAALREDEQRTTAIKGFSNSPLGGVDILAMITAHKEYTHEEAYGLVELSGGSHVKLRILGLEWTPASGCNAVSSCGS